VATTLARGYGVMNLTFYTLQEIKQNDFVDMGTNLIPSSFQNVLNCDLHEALSITSFIYCLYFSISISENSNKFLTPIDLLIDNKYK
jgi:hypothetical protein